MDLAQSICHTPSRENIQMQTKSGYGSTYFLRPASQKTLVLTVRVVITCMKLPCNALSENLHALQKLISM